MMIDKDITDLLQVSEIELFSSGGCLVPPLAEGCLKEKLDDFMRFANNRSLVGWRYIPVGFDFCIANEVKSTGLGYFNHYIDVQISIPYCRVGRGYGVPEQEEEIYRQYNFSIFRYKIIKGHSLVEVHQRLGEIISGFNDEPLSVIRPIGMGVQQESSYIPQPAVQGFYHRFSYIGIILYEEIYKDRWSFLYDTEQIKRVDEPSKSTYFWKDGREIGSDFKEGIKKFPEDEGILFDQKMIIMFPEGGLFPALIPEDPGESIARRSTI